MELNREDAELMDKYLSALIDIKSKGQSFSHRGLMSVLNTNLKHVDYLTRKIIAFSQEVEEVVRPLNERSNIASIEIIHNSGPFLNRGGFIGYVNNKEEDSKLKKEKEDIEYKMLKRNYKWDLWLKILAVIGGTWGIFSIIKDLFFS